MRKTEYKVSINQMGECRVGGLKSAMPDRSNDVEFFPEIPKAWGLSFMINMVQAPTGRSAGSLAWAGLANTYFWIDPAMGIGGVYATQILPFADIRALPLYLDFEKIVYISIRSSLSSNPDPLLLEPLILSQEFRRRHDGKAVSQYLGDLRALSEKALVACNEKTTVFCGLDQMVGIEVVFSRLRVAAYQFTHLLVLLELRLRQ